MNIVYDGAGGEVFTNIDYYNGYPTLDRIDTLTYIQEQILFLFHMTVFMLLIMIALGLNMVINHLQVIFLQIT